MGNFDDAEWSRFDDSDLIRQSEEEAERERYEEWHEERNAERARLMDDDDEAEDDECSSPCPQPAGRLERLANHALVGVMKACIVAVAVAALYGAATALVDKKRTIDL
ncbi:hypothetical protein KTD19_12515 [Burkholderia multivorans]|uniref:hypothetical protein n=1 Tax=Burkholderia multivorans TaxID=87883 RepID=UPI0012DC8B21|nr:hypothetical protein [Burkholderia multivorans]MBU9233216.1 hypothetical protein [Burkholderia multivorans]QGR95072.1 hypothetical protein FOC30_30110 [Burkholderia multivorans]HEF4739709.1 hypothetical protein [Burkholderia multivorans]